MLRPRPIVLKVLFPAILLVGSCSPGSLASTATYGLAQVVGTDGRSIGATFAFVAQPSTAGIGTTAPATGDGSVARTQPAVLRFAVKGDWGTGLPGQARVTARMCELWQRLPFDYVLTTGDNFYSPDGVATVENYFGPEWCLYSRPGHQWRAAWGNHDYGGQSAALALGAPPEPRYYAWQAGDVAFFAYDGTEVTKAQRDWLRAAVCGSTARVKIIYGHQPAFSTGPHGSEEAVQTMVHPIASQCGAQLVLAGHDHIYMRSKPIDGVTYVVTGGAGGVLYPCLAEPWWLARCLSREHFLLVEVTEGAIRVTAVGAEGEVLEGFNVEVGR